MPMFVVVKLSEQDLDIAKDIVAIRPTENAAWNRCQQLAEAALETCEDPEAEICQMVMHHGVLETFLNGDDGYICGWTVVAVQDC